MRGLGWQWIATASFGILTGCALGPSEERLYCLQGCARDKDVCMLHATTAAAVQLCDRRGQNCSETCPP